MRRYVLLSAVVALLATSVAPALADEPTRDVPVRDVVVDEPASDVAKDEPVDTVVDDSVGHAVDRCRVTDVVTDRCHAVDRPHDINYRTLIIRLIKAHEWEKLLRLLHLLGVI